MRFIIRSAAFALAAGVSSAAIAAPAVNLLTPGLHYGGGLYTLGFEFSVIGGQSIDALGVYDDNGDGLTSDASIGLWDTSGNLLTSATIAAGGGTLNGLFRFASITPYALTAGTNYIVGAYTQDMATSLNTNQGGTGSFHPLITVHSDRYSNFNSAFSFPDSSDGFQGAWLGGNFNLVANGGIPEPSTWAMLLIGFGTLGAAMRRRKLAGHHAFA